MEKNLRLTKKIISGNYEYTLIESGDRNGKYPPANWQNNPGYALKAVKPIHQL